MLVSPISQPFPVQSIAPGGVCLRRNFRRHCATIPEWWPPVCYDDAAQGCEIRCTTDQTDAKDEESSSDSRRVHPRAEKKKDEKITTDKKTERKKSETKKEKGSWLCAWSFPKDLTERKKDQETGIRASEKQKETGKERSRDVENE